jgi:hypothetical protein
VEAASSSWLHGKEAQSYTFLTKRKVYPIYKTYV